MLTMLLTCKMQCVCVSISKHSNNQLMILSVILKQMSTLSLYAAPVTMFSCLILDLYLICSV